MVLMITPHGFLLLNSNSTVAKSRHVCALRTRVKKFAVNCEHTCKPRTSSVYKSLILGLSLRLLWLGSTGIVEWLGLALVLGLVSSVCMSYKYVCVSVVVGVDAELAEQWVDDVVKCEDRIVSQSRALLPADVNEQLLDPVNEILRPLGLQTRLLVLERANSIAFFFMCMTLSAVVTLRDQWRTRQLRDIAQKLLTFLSGNTDSDGDTCPVYVKRLTWPLADYERCLEFFTSLQGKIFFAAAFLKTCSTVSPSLWSNQDGIQESLVFCFS